MHSNWVYTLIFTALLYFVITRFDFKCLFAACNNRRYDNARISFALLLPLYINGHLNCLTLRGTQDIDSPNGNTESIMDKKKYVHFHWMYALICRNEIDFKCLVAA